MSGVDLKIILVLAGIFAAVLYRLKSARPTSVDMTSAADKQKLLPPVYSLWLAPASSSPSSAVFTALNASLPGPTFPSHATLLGSAPKGASLDQVLQGIRQALVEWRGSERKEGDGLEVPLEDVRFGDEFFRCVLVKLVDDPVLHLLHNVVLQHLPSPSERPIYLPHISLVYSNMPAEERKQIVSGLYASGRARRVDVDVAGVELRAGGQESQGVRSALFDRIVIVVTKDVLPEQWRPVAEIAL